MAAAVALAGVVPVAFVEGTARRPPDGSPPPVSTPQEAALLVESRAPAPRFWAPHPSHGPVPRIRLTRPPETPDEAAVTTMPALSLRGRTHPLPNPFRFLHNGCRIP
ncbi:hypothetical protein M2169_000447 [Streptomyces sp. MJP52]|nr:hypothetical protein [Streptomyces sp. MJP52]